MEARNGTRQPHRVELSLLMLCCVSRIAISETNKQNVAVIWMKLV